MNKQNKFIMALITMLVLSVSGIGMAQNVDLTITTSHAGHGGLNNFDPGAVANGKQESKIARNINSLIIQKTGAKDATDNSGSTVNQNLSNIVTVTNRLAGYDTWNLSNHLNSAGPLATGVEVYYFGPDPAAKAKAEQVSLAIAKALGLPNRGAKDGSGLYVIRNTTGKMLLIEWGFISNSNDVKSIETNADKAVNAMLASFGYNFDNKPIVPPAPPARPTYPVGSIVVPLSSHMSFYVVDKGPLGYVIATGQQWEDSSKFTTDKNNVKVGSIVQMKDNKFSYYVANIRHYADSRTEYLIATQVRDIAYSAVK